MAHFPPPLLRRCRMAEMQPGPGGDFYYAHCTHHYTPFERTDEEVDGQRWVSMSLVCIHCLEVMELRHRIGSCWEETEDDAE